MQTISVDTLSGISPEFQHVLYQGMRTCTTGQRLAVCLYFMSDLADDNHRLSDIEHNLRLMFPPSLERNYTPDDYTDFQASAIRYYFNDETRDVNNGHIDSKSRLWKYISRGHWKNTDIGNQYAVKLLSERDIVVQRIDNDIEPVLKDLPLVNRGYLQEKLAEEARAQEQQERGNLLSPSERILGADTQIEDEQAQRLEVVIYRVLRDTQLARTIKNLHENLCQICGATIHLADGKTYSEAHHIKPLGKPHNGPDIAGNILILCPNHHILCDYGAINLDVSIINHHPQHNIDIQYIEYHNNVLVKI